MGRNRFASTATVRLELSDSDWIEVKERLSYGEMSRLQTAALGQSLVLHDGEEPSPALDLGAYHRARAEAYILDWSFCDEAGQPVEVSRAAIEALDAQTGQEITAALDAHSASRDPKATSSARTTARTSP